MLEQLTANAFDYLQQYWENAALLPVQKRAICRQLSAIVVEQLAPEAAKLVRLKPGALRKELHDVLGLLLKTDPAAKILVLELVDRPLESKNALSQQVSVTGMYNQVITVGSDIIGPVHIEHQSGKNELKDSQVGSSSKRYESRKEMDVQEQGSYHVSLVDLRQMLETHFNESELRDLCFGLKLDYENLSGSGKADKTRELVTHFARRGTIPELVKECAHRRPHVVW